MLFLIISFSVWGIGDIFRGNTLKKAVAKVGGVEISVMYLNQAFDKALVQIKQKLDPNMTSQQARQAGLLDQTLEREITRQLLDMDIKRQGINIGPEVVLDILAREPQFRTEDGKFNKQLFVRFLDQQRISEAQFIAQGQQDIARQVLSDAIDGNAIVSQTMIDALYKARAQKRILDVVTIEPSKLGGIAAPSDAALQKFYDDNKSMFTAPEYRSFTVAVLAADALAEDIAVSDADLKKAYDARRDELASPEQRDFVQVVLQNEEKAKQLAVSARASKNLSSAAASMKENAVPLNGMESNKLMPALSKAAFALREGDVSDPVKTQLGWHVVQLKKIIQAAAPDFDKVKNKLREELRREQAIESATRAVNALDDKLAAGTALEDIAEGLKLRLTKVPSVDAKGLKPDGKPASAFPYKETALALAFGQDAGETSPVEDDRSGNYYVVRTDGLTPSGVRPFAEVKSQVAAAWKASEQKQKAEVMAEKIAKGLSSGAALSSFDGGDGVSVRASEPLSLLGDADDRLPEALMKRAFKIEKGQAITESAGDKLFVARLARIIDVDGAKEDIVRKSLIAKEIKKSMTGELDEQYLQHLRTVFPVKVNEGLLNSLRQRDN